MLSADVIIPDVEIDALFEACAGKALMITGYDPLGVYDALFSNQEVRNELWHHWYSRRHEYPWHCPHPLTSNVRT